MGLILSIIVQLYSVLCTSYP